MSTDPVVLKNTKEIYRYILANIGKIHMAQKRENVLMIPLSKELVQHWAINFVSTMFGSGKETQYDLSKYTHSELENYAMILYPIGSKKFGEITVDSISKKLKAYQDTGKTSEVFINIEDKSVTGWCGESIDPSIQLKKISAMVLAPQSNNPVYALDIGALFVNRPIQVSWGTQQYTENECWIIVMSPTDIYLCQNPHIVGYSKVFGQMDLEFLASVKTHLLDYCDVAEPSGMSA